MVATTRWRRCASWSGSSTLGLQATSADKLTNDRLKHV